jgi:hypothetical protein
MATTVLLCTEADGILFELLFLWSSGHSSWLQIRRSRVRSPGPTRKKRVMGLERGPISLVSTTQEYSVLCRSYSIPTMCLP